MRLHDRILAWFTDWFGSGGGVWQTTYFTLGIVVVECFNRRLDPHAFILMAALTVYSAITQPALAHSGNQSQKMLISVLAEQRELIENQRKMLSDEFVVDTKTYELVKELAKR